MVHDPLGLELVLGGTIHGEVVRFEDWKQQEVGSIQPLGEKFSLQHHGFSSWEEDQNTLRIGIVVLSPR